MSQCEQKNDGHGLNIETIYAEHDGFIRSVIQFAAKNEVDREDIYQEVFVALSHKGDFSDIRNVKGYLYRLILNKVNEFLRKRAFADIRLKSYGQRKASKEETSVDQNLLVSDEAEKTIELIKAYLSGKESEAVLLRFRDDCDNEQAAQKMNVRKETLVRYISVGLKKIREIVRSQEGL